MIKNQKTKSQRHDICSRYECQQDWFCKNIIWKEGWQCMNNDMDCYNTWVHEEMYNGNYAHVMREKDGLKFVVLKGARHENREYYMVTSYHVWDGDKWVFCSENYFDALDDYNDRLFSKEKHDV